MNFLLDTNVVSEWAKPRPDPGVVAWLADVDEDRTFVSVVTLAELSYGIDRLAMGRRRKQLEEWLRQDLSLRFEGRVLSIDPDIAEATGTMMARREASGRPIGIMDAFIAATVERRDLALVTRNAADFAPARFRIVTPWSGAG